MRLGLSFPPLDVSPVLIPFVLFKVALRSFAPAIVAAGFTGVMPILVGEVKLHNGDFLTSSSGG